MDPPGQAAKVLRELHQNGEIEGKTAGMFIRLGHRSSWW